jgi:hypothetical protein
VHMFVCVYAVCVVGLVKKNRVSIPIKRGERSKARKSEKLAATGSMAGGAARRPRWSGGEDAPARQQS